MKSKELKRFLAGSAKSFETLQWLQNSFLPLVVRHLNETDSRRRLSLYGGDRIPENERNLTDSRNRISLILEYEFARVITKILTDANSHDLFCAYVVANRFPDLEIRNDKGKLGLRFEVKCLQSIAEEKSANLATLRKDIQPITDFIVVFLWDWTYKRTTTQWDRAPYVVDFYVFNASSLATLRDWYWLNRPPTNVGNGYQGFDLRYAVNCAQGKYNEEEGNFGKLLRLWQNDFPYRPPEDDLLLKTEGDYCAFKDHVVVHGFTTLAGQMLPALSGKAEIVEVQDGGRRIGFKSQDLGFFLSSRLGTSRGNVEKKLNVIMREDALSEVWVLRDKYQWQRYGLRHGRVELIRTGKKPKTIIADRHAD